MLSPSNSISPKDLWNAIATRRSSSMCAGATPTSNRHGYLVQSGVMRAKPSIGLHAVPLGLSALAGNDDHGAARTWFHGLRCSVRLAALAAEERHNWPAEAA